MSLPRGTKPKKLTMSSQKYIVQVSVKNNEGEYEWKNVQPSHSNNPYEFDNENEAYRMINMCYPCKITHRVRVTTNN